MDHSVAELGVPIKGKGKGKGKSKGKGMSSHVQSRGSTSRHDVP